MTLRFLWIRRRVQWRDQFSATGFIRAEYLMARRGWNRDCRCINLKTNRIIFIRLNLMCLYQYVIDYILNELVPFVCKIYNQTDLFAIFINAELFLVMLSMSRIVNVVRR